MKISWILECLRALSGPDQSTGYESGIHERLTAHLLSLKGGIESVPGFQTLLKLLLGN